MFELFKKSAPRQLEWHSVESRDFDVIHWKRHTPEELRDLVASKPDKVIGNKVKVKLYALGPHTVAVRTVPYALYAFRQLVRAAARKAAVLEMPVAYVRDRNDETHLITLWKKGTKPFGKFVDDSHVPFQTKQRAVLQIARDLGQLHAAGFAHTHVKPGNVVVDEKGNAKLVDSKLIMAIEGPDDVQIIRRKKDVFGTLSLTALVRTLYDADPGFENKPNYKKFLAQVLREYDAHFLKHSAKQKRA